MARAGNLNKKSSPKKRSYDNSKRATQSSKNQTTIVEALVELLAEKKGGEVQIQEIAEKTGLTTRTIFRFFKDKKTLHEAMDTYLMSYLNAGSRQLNELDFVDFGRNAVRLFEEHEAITLAYVLSPLGKDARELFRKKLNKLMISKITEEYKIKQTAENSAKMAMIANLVNAKVWYDLKSEHELSGKQIEETIGWGLETLLEALSRGQ